MKISQKGFGAVEGLLIVLVLSVVGFGGYYVWNQNRDKQESKAVPTQTNETQPAKQTTKTEIAKKYTSLMYPSMSFDVPAGWTVTEPKEYDEGVWGPGWADGELTVTDGKTKLMVSLSTVKATGFEGYTCWKFRDVTKVGGFYRYKDHKGVISYRNGITSGDEDWPDREKEFYNFQDAQPNYCVSFPYLRTYSSKLKQADYPNLPYGISESGEVQVWLLADVEGPTNATTLKVTDSIINSLSKSVD